MPSVRTANLQIAYEEGGPATGKPVLLLHGWPDAPRTWHAVAAKLNAVGYRTISPFLRGFGETKFLDAETPRVAQPPVLAQDAIDLADALGLERFALVGHDWGARTAYTAAALFPERLTSITAMSVAYQPRGEAKAPGFEQAMRYWYQWFMCTDGGVAKVKDDPIGFARIQWETWSPAGWFSEAEFAETAKSFSNPDWVAITLNSYRSRWRQGEPKAEQTDARYDGLTERLKQVENLSTPTLMLHGAVDTCAGVEQSEGAERYFTGGYQREVIEGAGHFVQRESPGAVAAAVSGHLATHS
jgi:pimeloyl-ACP methyl ester carboxylesterase